MGGLTEYRGAAQDSFWSWRELMYRFLDRLDAIHRRVTVPLVVHGGTSFPADAVDAAGGLAA